MNRPRLEVSEIFQEHENTFLEAYGRVLTPGQSRVLTAIMQCRTAALGGHKRTCSACDHEEIAYNSCRNRHCPKCQATAQAEWLSARVGDLLPVQYFHVVFTLPDELRSLALTNKKMLYGLLFQAASSTLKTIALDTKHLGAEIGFLAVIHTWGQALLHHPHLHCIVPGGGLSPDGDRWVTCRENFFLSVRVLSRLFRRRFLEALDAAFRAGKLSFHGKNKPLAEPKVWAQFVAPLRKIEWNVYSKPPFGGPVQVLKYLARYTHRVAFSNRRLISINNGRVSFSWKDYATGMTRSMTLDAAEFMRRFLLHVLPSGFVRIRQYGFLSNGVRKRKLDHIRTVLSETGEMTDDGDDKVNALVQSVTEPCSNLCPKCKRGQLVVTETVYPSLKIPEELVIATMNTS